MLSRFHLIPERNGRTDRQTDGQICYINTVRDKNWITILRCEYVFSSALSSHVKIRVKVIF